MASARVEFSAQLLPHPHSNATEEPARPEEDTTPHVASFLCPILVLNNAQQAPNPVGAARVRERAALTKAAAAAAPSCRGAWTPGHSLGREGRGDPGPAQPCPPGLPVHLRPTSRPPAPHAGSAPHEEKTTGKGSQWGCLSLFGKNEDSREPLLF